MDPNRFDHLAKSLGRAHSRRTVLAAIEAAALGAVGLGRRSALAQGTPTPTALPPGLAANNGTLFVQTASGGTFSPNPQAGQPLAPPAAGTPTAATHGAYLLTLHGHSGETVGFSDRPRRDYGEVPTTRFFTGLGFLPYNPPNAALVADLPGQADAVVLVELLNPAYDAPSQTLTYEANLLHTYPNAKGSALAALATQAQATVPATFGAASLFIDDCPDSTENCWVVPATPGYCAVIGIITSGNCWSWSTWTCNPCGSYSGTCATSFPEECTNTTCLDDIALCGNPGCCNSACTGCCVMTATGWTCPSSCGC